MGCLPDSPYAARSLRAFSARKRQNGSSLTTQLALYFGYTTRSKFWPKALLSSALTAAVKNSRSLNPTCSCRKKPSVASCSASPEVNLLAVVAERAVSPTVGKTEPSEYWKVLVLR